MVVQVTPNSLAKHMARMVMLLLCVIIGLTKNMCLNILIIKEEVMDTIRTSHQITDLGYMCLNLKLLEMLPGNWAAATQPYHKWHEQPHHEVRISR